MGWGRITTARSPLKVKLLVRLHCSEHMGGRKMCKNSWKQYKVLQHSQSFYQQHSWWLSKKFSSLEWKEDFSCCHHRHTQMVTMWGDDKLISLNVFGPFWPLDAKSRLTGKDPDAGKEWRQEEKMMTEDEMVGWHHWFNGHEFEQTPVDDEGQRNLVCCSTWSCKELDTT